MHKKRLRLKTKDVRFLTRKGNKYYGKYFSLHTIVQYPNIPNNQISCHISIKYDKRAVHRNKIKKIILNHIQDNNILQKKRNEKHYKIFIGLNKKNIEEFKKELAKLQIKEQKIAIKHILDTTFREREQKVLYRQNSKHNDKKIFKNKLQRKD